MEMVSKPDADIMILADLISRDPMLSATIMKYANSPMYRRMVEVTSIRNAVSLLGLKNVSTAVAVATMRSFNVPPNAATETIWEHSFGVSALAKKIARHCCRRLADQIEFSAMVHDMGALVLAANFKDEYSTVMTQAINQQQPLEKLEQESLGISHDQVLVKMAEDMRFPQNTISVLSTFHAHEPLLDVKTDDKMQMAVLSLAHHLEHRAYGESRAPETIPDSVENLQKLLRISSETLDDIVEEYEDILSKQLAGSK